LGPTGRLARFCPPRAAVVHRQRF